MNAQDVTSTPKIKRESKNKISVDFDRTPLKERLKARFLSTYFLQNVVWYIFRLVLLIGISYVILFPFLTKISSSFMSQDDFIDVTVRLIPKHFTLDTYKAIINELGYWEALLNTFTMSFTCALGQMIICSFIGYGFAKFNFKGNKLLFALVMLSMIIPHQTLQNAIVSEFRYFDIFGIFQFLGGGGLSILDGIDAEATGFLGGLREFNEFLCQTINVAPHKFLSNGDIRYTTVWSSEGLNLCNTYVPMYVLSLTGLAFKNGLYIYMLRQFFTGVPDALEESAYLDGAGTMRTFFQIILPLSVPMMITVFLFAFCWQWTDDFYTNILMPQSKTLLLTKIVGIPPSLNVDYAGTELFKAAIQNTCGLLIIFPLIILYVFCQNFLVQGIERSGLTAD